MKQQPLGRHLLLELYACDRDRLDDLTRLERALKEAARRSGATIVETVFHRFMPHGVSGVVVVAESHLAIHTWPEYGYAAVDFFTCGADIDYWRARDFLQEALVAESCEVKELLRGGHRGADGRPGPAEND